MRDDREHDLGLAHDGAEAGQQFQRRVRGEPPRPLASPCEGGDGADAAARERTGQRASHRAGADDGDGLHPGDSTPVVVLGPLYDSLRGWLLARIG